MLVLIQIDWQLQKAAPDLNFEMQERVLMEIRLSGDKADYSGWAYGLDVEAKNLFLDTIIELNIKEKGLSMEDITGRNIERICDKVCIMKQERGILFGEKDFIG